MILKEKFIKSNFFKMICSIIVVIAAIEIYRSGYDFGQWVHKITY